MSTPQERILRHIGSCRTALISTLNADGTPHASYAPFIMDQERFYILVSEAARHSANLLRRPRCALLFIEDESRAEQLFARKRVGLECLASEIPAGNPAFERITALMEERFGDIVTLLTGMPDFHLIELSAQSGEAVFGFGDAYLIETPFEEVTPKRTGHRRE